MGLQAGKQGLLLLATKLYSEGDKLARLHTAASPTNLNCRAGWGSGGQGIAV